MSTPSPFQKKEKVEDSAVSAPTNDKNSANTLDKPVIAQNQPIGTPITSMQTSSTDSSQTNVPPALQAAALMNASNPQASRLGSTPSTNETPPIPTKSQENISSLSITTPETTSKNEMEIINEQFRIKKVIECINNGRRKITGINNQTNAKGLIGTKEFPASNVIKNRDGGYIVKSMSIQDNAEVTAHLSNAAFNLLLNEQLKFEIDKNKVDIIKLQSKASAIQQEIEFRERQQDVSQLITIEKIVLARRYLRSVGVEITYEVVNAGQKEHKELDEKNYEITLKNSTGNIQTKYFTKEELNNYAAQQVKVELVELDNLRNELDLYNQKLLYKTAEHRDTLLMRLKTVDHDLEKLNKENVNVNTVNRDEFDDLLENHHAEKISKAQSEFGQIKNEFQQVSEDIDKNLIPQTLGKPQKAVFTKIQDAQPKVALHETVQYPEFPKPKHGVITHAQGNISGARESRSITRTFNDTTLLDAIGSAVKTFTNSREINKSVAINLSQKEITVTSTDPRKDIHFKATTTSVSTDKTTDKNLQTMSVALVENLRYRLDADSSATNLSIQLGNCQPPEVATKFAKFINIELNKLKVTRTDLADRIKNVPEPTTPIAVNSPSTRSSTPGSSSSLN